MYSDITENLKKIENNIAESKIKYRKHDDVVRLMAVTKTVPYDRVNYAVSLGITLLGENRVQEFLEKKDFYDNSAEIHFIGHLQSNKVKNIVNNVSLIHSVDSYKLACEINRHSLNNNIISDILIEVNIGGEASKTGISPDVISDLTSEISDLSNVRIKGIMTIPPNDDRTEYYFDKMNRLFSDLKTIKFKNTLLDTLSMGMTDDYALAVKHGANIVRIGSGIFGTRK